MPNRNGTGPEGKGPKTGRGLGTCNGETSKENTVFGRGHGNGLGLRRNTDNKKSK